MTDTTHKDAKVAPAPAKPKASCAYACVPSLVGRRHCLHPLLPPARMGCGASMAADAAANNGAEMAAPAAGAKAAADEEAKEQDNSDPLDPPREPDKCVSPPARAPAPTQAKC